MAMARVESRYLRLDVIQHRGLVIPAVVFLYFCSRAKVAVHGQGTEGCGYDTDVLLLARCCVNTDGSYSGHRPPPPHTRMNTPLHGIHTQPKSSGPTQDCYQITVFSPSVTP
ncbi:hypothetical protein ABVT39_016121 [Epinephelus coioides]